MSEMIQAGFDYGALPAESASRLQEIKRDIAIIDTLACVQIGQKLKEAQLELNMRGKSGAGFQEWIESETPYALTAAYEMIRINTRFGENDMRNSAHHFSYSVLARLAAPSTPDSVIEKAIEQGSAGEKVTVADVKQWKEAAQAAEQRAEEFRIESNSRRKTIRELETQIDLLKSAPPEIQIQTPADYEATKAKAAKLEIALAESKKQQAALVQKQVADKLKERAEELEKIDKEVAERESRLAGLKQQIDRYSLQQRELKVHLDTIESARVAMAILAANLEGFEAVIDHDNELRLWRALSQMLRNGAEAIDFFVGDAKPRLVA